MTDKPIFFERNRVGRVYKGGKLFSDFFGDEAVDGFKPEEWIASSVKALNKEMSSEKEGVSKLERSDLYFDDLLKENSDEMLGKNGRFRILVKVLDSAVRLPAQAHPDKSFSRRFFDSEYGKTESWIILGTRPDAAIYFGFKDGVGKEDFIKAISDSRADKDAMERLMKRIEPQVGDVFLVPAKTVHAIGAGCLILEVQEPTDFTIQPEHWCAEYELSADEMYIGLSEQDAVKCFDFDKCPDARVEAEIVSDNNGVKVEKLIKDTDTDCFAVNRITLNHSSYTINVDNSYGVYIVTSGSGKIKGEAYQRDIKKGDYFFMPYCLMGKYEMVGSLEVIECY